MKHLIQKQTTSFSISICTQKTTSFSISFGVKTLHILPLLSQDDLPASYQKRFPYSIQSSLLTQRRKLISKRDQTLYDETFLKRLHRTILAIAMMLVRYMQVYLYRASLEHSEKNNNPSSTTSSSIATHTVTYQQVYERLGSYPRSSPDYSNIP